MPRVTKPSRSVRHFCWRLFRAGLIVYLVVILVLDLFQARLIFPGSASQGHPDAAVQPEADEELVSLKTTDGERVVALFAPALDGRGRRRTDVASRPTLLYFYGNGMCLGVARDQLERFRRLGVNVLIPDYLGFGLSSGSPSERGCQETARVALAYLRSRADVDRRSIVVGGWSLGGAVAIDLAAREPEIAGLVVLSSFTSMVDMANRLYPFAPISLLLKHRFESRQAIARVTCPIFIAHGRLDRAVPFEMSGALAAAAKAPVTQIAIEGAEHVDLFELGGAALWGPLARFLENFRANR